MLCFNRRRHANEDSPISEKKTQQCQRNREAFFFDSAHNFSSFKGFKKNWNDFQSKKRQKNLLFFEQKISLPELLSF